MTKFNNEDVKSILGTNEMSDYRTLGTQLFAEFIGTFLYLSIVLFAGTSFGTHNLTIAFANGLLVASIVQIIGHVSGGHINPAVTVGALACGHIKVFKAISYVIAQILGSIIGSLVAYVLSDENTRGNLGATVPFSDLGEDQVFGIEFLMTFVLVAVVLSVYDNIRSAGGLGSAPLAIGLSVAACQASALNYTGSLNPVRSLGPAVIMNIWTSHWVFWMGPLLGGLLAGLLYKFVFTLQDRNVSIGE